MFNLEIYNTKEKRAKKAHQHTADMEEHYQEAIKKSIASTIIYSLDFICEKNRKNSNMEIVLEPLDSVSAIAKYYNGKTTVLNFASYKNPGGKFYDGSLAQEECLCHESFLYNVLSKFPEYYNWNKTCLKKALYSNRALYSEDIYFFTEKGELLTNVITCAAPNYSVGYRYKNVSKEENSMVLKDRIRFVLDIAKEQETDTLILGAFGCGVFRQDAKEVAEIFKNYLEKDYNCFKKVIFAVPIGKDGNYAKFQEILKQNKNE